jgi:ribosomal protein S18 acetylase RimI-like enzyme
MTDITLRSLNTVPEPELAALSDEVFGHEQPSELLADVVAAEAHAYSVQTDEKQPGTFGLAALRGNKLVGWTEGFRVGSNQFHMLNSGVAVAERRTGVYSQLVQAVLDHAKSHGYSTVRSLHVATNTPVIVAKLRLGFFIAGFEYSEVYGPLVQLKYLVGEQRRRLYRARTESIRPASR